MFSSQLISFVQGNLPQAKSTFSSKRKSTFIQPGLRLSPLYNSEWPWSFKQEQHFVQQHQCRPCRLDWNAPQERNPLPIPYAEVGHCSGYFFNAVSNDNIVSRIKNCLDHPFNHTKPQSRIFFTFCGCFDPSHTIPHLNISLLQRALSHTSIHLNISTSFLGCSLHFLTENLAC